jgi:hypothetical protein
MTTIVDEPKELLRSRITTVVVIVLTLVTIATSVASFSGSIQMQAKVLVLQSRIDQMEHSGSILAQVDAKELDYLRAELRAEHEQRLEAEKR